uniref:Uncharacterized protein n=1 Tax=Anopheles minimus TaxID=112268 RepID=A0A182WPP9_9DIPT
MDAISFATAFHLFSDGVSSSGFNGVNYAAGSDLR